MKDIILFVENDNGDDVSLCWEKKHTVFGGFDLVGVYTNDVIHHIGQTSDLEDEISTSKAINIGKVKLYQAWLGCMIYVVGERSDLMKAVHVFGELKESGDFGEVVAACCEMTVL